ncbi:MAG: hypothetical protein JO203_16135 [Gammaproteobacteria bacterium]|nr:hypothetical protein [Gammaproteobacteria bacterium]MBV8405719.1 hypothetical protein [Gammaproteobacteria bacterium]
MTRRTPTPCPAALCAALLGVVPVALYAAKPPATLTLPAGARVGIVNLLDAEVTHFHASRQIENSFLKTYTVNWPVSTMLLGAVHDRLAQLGLTPVPLAPSDALRRSRESCFLEASLAKGLPKECGPLYAQLAASEGVSALVVLGPGRNDSAHAAGTRHKELPEYLRGWCFVTGGSEPLPVLLDMSELLLVGVSGSQGQLIARAWGGDGKSWSGYRPPADLKAFPAQALDQLQPLYAEMLKQQADAALAALQSAH